MSWISAAFTRSKAAISAGVSLVPVVGAYAAGAISNIHTGDEHIDSRGVWVNNSDNSPVNQVNAAAQAEIDRVAATNRQIADLARQSAADSAARIGGGLSLEAASRLGPPGNVYTKTLAFAKGSPLVTIAGVLLVAFLIYIAIHRGK